MLLGQLQTGPMEYEMFGSKVKAHWSPHRGLSGPPQWPHSHRQASTCPAVQSRGCSQDQNLLQSASIGSMLVLITFLLSLTAGMFHINWLLVEVRRMEVLAAIWHNTTIIWETYGVWRTVGDCNFLVIGCHGVNLLADHLLQQHNQQYQPIHV